MVASQIYTALDIGESITKLVVGVVHSAKLHVCATYKTLTKGVKDGEIYSKTELQTVLTTLLDRARGEGFNVREIVLVLPSNNMNIYRKKAENVIPQTRLISPADIKLLKKAVCKHQIMDHEMVIGVYPIQYMVGNDIYKNEPTGIRGNKIVLDAFLITAPIAIARGYVDLLQDMEITVVDVIIAPLANASLLLKSQEYKKGALILDLGAQNNSVATFYDYLFCGYKQGYLGTEKIIEDLMKNYDIDIKNARSIYQTYGSADLAGASNIGVLQLPGSERSIPEIEIVTLVDNVLNMILTEVKENIEFLVKDANLPLIITGGGALIPAIAEKCEQFLGLKCHSRNFGRIGGFNPQFNAAIGGLVNYLANNSLINISLVQI